MGPVWPLHPQPEPLPVPWSPPCPLTTYWRPLAMGSIGDGAGQLEMRNWTAVWPNKIQTWFHTLGQLPQLWLIMTGKEILKKEWQKINYCSTAVTLSSVPFIGNFFSFYEGLGLMVLLYWAWSIKLNSVQEPCTKFKFFVVYIPKFEILQTT